MPSIAVGSSVIGLHVQQDSNGRQVIDVTTSPNEYRTTIWNQPHPSRIPRGSGGAGGARPCTLRESGEVPISTPAHPTDEQSLSSTMSDPEVVLQEDDVTSRMMTSSLDS